MRFHLKKTLTWLLAVTCFLLLSFNFRNRHVWLLTSSGAHPWGQDFDVAKEHDKVHRPKYVGNGLGLEPTMAVREVTKVINESRVRQLTTEAPGQETWDSVLWPDKIHYNNDRIINQLRYKPTWLAEKEKKNEPVPLKKILLYSGIGGWQVQRGQHTFLDQKCTVNTCELMDQRSLAPEADAILFHHSPQRPWTHRPLSQIWILFMLESPYHTPGLGAFQDVFNWTATYRHDSDIVAPYERFTPWDENVHFLPQNKSFAEGKTKQVAWFVSNCGARNGRKEYANELAKYISVDIYGACGTLKCPRKDKKCLEMLNTDYKFYLSFENSNCRDYISEKFFVNGLMHDVIPIVMGGAPEDYARAAPPHSFIHVDDFESPQQLAEYLHKLDHNDDLYNEYFRWKGTGRLINTLFWCRVCAMLHEDSRPAHSYRNLEGWWRGDGVCIGRDSWRKHTRTSDVIINDNV